MTRTWNGRPAQRAQWLRDADGLPLSKVATLLARARQQGRPIRQPSGLRAAKEAWQALDADVKREVAESAATASSAV